MDVHRPGDLLVCPGSLADRREYADLDSRHESRGLSVGLGNVLQTHGGDWRTGGLWILIFRCHAATPIFFWRSKAGFERTGNACFACRSFIDD
jgi:hypothetical protein